MGKINDIVIILFWLIQALYFYLLWLYWIQVKEYRFDRFSSFVRSSDGIGKLRLKVSSLKIILIILSFYIIQIEVALILLLVYLNIKIVLSVFKKRIRRPVFTERIKKVCYLGAISLLVTLIYPSLNIVSRMLLGEFLLSISLFIGILWTSIIVKNVKKRELDMASNILKKVNPKIIGITGSYGKTTTKEFVSALLSYKYDVEKTVLNENTDLGIARKIINDFDNNCEVFVCEMGAYKPGEIRNICKYIKPKIAIITGIEEQHLELFGSIENIIKAKFEIIESLDEYGIAIFNTTNPYVLEMQKTARVRRQDVKTFSYEVVKNFPKQAKDNSMYSRIISVSTEAICFEIFYENKTEKFTTNLNGFHFIENVTGAILTARLLGVDLNSIKDAVEKLQSPKGVMKFSKLAYGSILIDDSYNSTPASFESAIKYSKHFKNYKKLLITPGIIELGEKEADIHKNIAGKVSRVFDEIIITRQGIDKIFIENCRETKVSLILDEDKIIDSIEKAIEKGYYILAEGRQMSSVMKYLEKRKV